MTITRREVRDGDGRSSRRAFSDAQKQAIVAETEVLGATVSAVARRHGVVASLLFRWRAQEDLGQGGQRDSRDRHCAGYEALPSAWIA